METDRLIKTLIYATVLQTTAWMLIILSIWITVCWMER